MGSPGRLLKKKAARGVPRKGGEKNGRTAVEGGGGRRFRLEYPRGRRGDEDHLGGGRSVQRDRKERKVN